MNKSKLHDLVTALDLAGFEIINMNEIFEFHAWNRTVLSEYGSETGVIRLEITPKKLDQT